jgi:hypothetical protein
VRRAPREARAHQAVQGIVDGLQAYVRQILEELAMERSRGRVAPGLAQEPQDRDPLARRPQTARGEFGGRIGVL